jgi:hypothetical protein
LSEQLTYFALLGQRKVEATTTTTATTAKAKKFMVFASKFMKSGKLEQHCRRILKHSIHNRICCKNFSNFVSYIGIQLFG